MKKLIFVLGIILILTQLLPAQIGKKLSGHTDYVNAVCYSPGGRFLASGGFDGTIKIWDSKTGELLKDIKTGYKIYKLSFGEDYNRVCAGTVPLYGISTTLDSFIVVYNTIEGKPNTKFDIENKSPNFFVSGKNLIGITPELLADSCEYSYDYTLKRYSLANCYKVILKYYDLSGNKITNFSLTDKIHLWNFNSPWYITGGGNYLAVCPLFDESSAISTAKVNKIDKKFNLEENGSQVYFYDIKNNKLIKKIKIINSYLRLKNVLLSEDCKYFYYTAVEYLNDVIKVLDVDKDEEVMNLSGHSREILCLALHPGGRLLASGSKDNTIRIWDLSNGKTIKVLEGHKDNVNYLSFSPDGRYLSSASDDNSVMIWDLNKVSKEIEKYSEEYYLNSGNTEKANEENSPLLKNK